MRLDRKETIRGTLRVVLLTAAISQMACGGSDPAPANGASNGASNGAPGGASATGESTGATADRATGEAGSLPNTRVRKRVVLLGTSLTAGLGLDPSLAYPALLQRKADSAGYAVNIVNAGLSGETSAGALRRAGWVLDQPAAVVMLEVGANDGLRGVNPDSTKANLVALIETIRREQPSAKVLLVQMEAPTNLGRGYTSRFHEVYAEAAQATGVTLLPFLLDGVAGVARLNQSDGIHPNAEGAELVAATVWKGLGPVLAEATGASTKP